MYILLLSVALRFYVFFLAIVTHFCIVVGYIRTSINDGPGCLMLRCPDASCGAAVGQDMITIFASDDDKRKYSKYLLRSYVEDNKKVDVEIYYNYWIFTQP